MNILIVTQYFWPEQFGINDLAKSLKSRGYNVSVLTGFPNYPGGKLYDGYRLAWKKIEYYEGIKVTRVPLLPRGLSGALRLSLNYISFMVVGSIMISTLCRDRYDAIFVYQPSPITAAVPAIVLKKKRNIPILLWVQDLWPESLTAAGSIRSRWILNVVEKLVKWIYRNTDKILIQSESFRRSITEKGGEKGKIKFFPNTVEDVYFSENNNMQVDTSNLPEGFKILFAGNIGEAQDFETILNAAERLKHIADLHWIILGDGRKAEWVRTRIKSVGLEKNVHMLGRRPMEEMPAFYKKADVLLVTLKNEYIFSLTIPGKVQSYLASGRPILAALDGEGAKTIVEAGAGIAGPAGDHEALAENAKILSRLSKEKREAFGINARKYFMENFDKDMLVDKLEKWLHDISETETAKSGFK